MQLLKRKRKLLLIAIDLGIFISVYLFISLLSHLSGSVEFSLPKHALTALIFGILIFTSRFLFRMYSNVWRYANSKSYLDIIISDLAGGIVAVVVSHFVPIVKLEFWSGIAFLAIFDLATLMSRLLYQLIYKQSNLSDLHLSKNSKIGVAIVGAGQVGALLAEDLMYNKNSHYQPICFIDNNEDKIGSRVCGLEVIADDSLLFGKIKSLPVQEIFIALPKIEETDPADLIEYYGKTGCKVKIYDLPVNENDAVKDNVNRAAREVKIDELLFRNSLKVANRDTRSYYSGKVVIVTGGGGSIGSELCRQIARSHPKQLIIFDIYENNAYDIQQELVRKYGQELNLAVEIGSVRDRARLNAVFAYYRPEVVFHAAAHKHVPLMEHSNCEAIKNNVLGTYNTADMAEKYGVKKFILVSTDKAVNPTNVMGASKRLCEMVVQCRTDSATAFAAVRFGNVLGSNGSVIPLFKNQIAAGGPVTITDKRIIRYFMTIPEASGLVMQAGAMANGGDLFVLDMGKPVKIIDLAENMIRLSGFKPYSEIDIIETGLRPGEKLYEELLIKTENLDKTSNNMIFIERDKPYTRAEMEEKLDVLRLAVKEAEEEIGAASIKAAMKSVVPTFRDPEEVNRLAAEANEMKEAQ